MANTPPNGNDTGGPFEAVRVLDCSDEATALAARWLADLGARVTRIESLAGDGLRRRGPFLGDVKDRERSLAHLRYNGGKESVALDLDTARGWEFVDRLAAGADVVIAPLAKNQAAREFFDPARFRTVHPDGASLIDVTFAFGESPPAGPASDLLGVAKGGLLYLNGFPEDAPSLPAGKLAYKQVALAASEASGAAILRKQRFGEPSHVLISMEEAVTWTTMQTANVNFYRWHGERPTRYGLKGLGAVGRTIYPTRDGKYVSFTINPPRWANYADWVANVTGDDTLLASEWAEPTYQAANIETIAGYTEALCATLDRDSVVEEGQRRGHLVTPVQNMADLASDPHLRERGFLENVDHPQFGQSLTMPRPPFASSTYRSRGRAAPVLGQHTIAVLKEDCGLGSGAIGELLALGIAAAAPVESKVTS